MNSRTIAEKIVEAGEVGGNDVVLEAGPGKGALTEILLPLAREVIAVEKDERLLFHLALKFKKEIAEKKLTLIEGDILHFNPEEYRLQTGGYKLIANIPYYITGQFLRKFLGVAAAPSKMVLMLQKEVAERIIAKKNPASAKKLNGENKESILSIAVKTYGEPKIIERVPAKMFSPEPEVDSAVILIDNISKKFFGDVDEKKFFAILKKGFGQKRKMLVNNLGLKDEASRKILDSCGIPQTARAENLSLSQWKSLTKKLLSF